MLNFSLLWYKVTFYNFLLGAGGGKPSFDDLDADEGGDSDDDQIPGLEQAE